MSECTGKDCNHSSHKGCECDNEKRAQEVVEEILYKVRENLETATDEDGRISLYRVMPPIRNKDGSKLSRNHPCPCGSDKKWKNCCQRNF